MPVFVRVALSFAVMAALTVLALPRARLAPWGVVDPPEVVVAATMAAVLLLLLGVALSSPAGPQGAATLALLVAFATVAGAVVGSTVIPGLVSSVAWLVSLSLVPAVVQMSLAWPRAWPERRAEGWLAAATWTAVGVIGMVRVTVWDPFADATCVLGCGDNPLALHHDPGLASLLLDTLLVGTALTCAATTVLVARPGRFWIGGVVCVVLAVDASLRLSANGPLSQATAVALHQARSVSLALVGVALAMTGWARLRRHGRLVRLAADLDASPPPGSYAAALGRALGDPSLRIDYSTQGHNLVDDTSSQPASRNPRGQVTTVLVRSGSTVATITHDKKHVDSLAAALGPSARMAIDNERLQVQLRSQLDELRASRGRIVERGDAERSRLERDLHDGAQQRLLMIGYELHQASRADPGLACALNQVNRDVETALDEVREIAHGIYPGILESLGLPAALDALADGPIPVDVQVKLTERLPAPAERALYHVVSTALGYPQRTEHARAEPLRATVGLQGAEVHLHLSGVGPVPTTLVQTWEDRLGALGGEIHTSGTVVEGWLPCE